jgi:NAD(P)-dependent dehydrogenase (short-subunit alcohol dehydrogenase family)
MLEGRVALVTGAGRGIGAAHAELLAGYGAAVVVNDLGTTMTGDGVDRQQAEVTAAAIRAGGATAVANTDDIATWAGAEAAVQQAVDEFGRLDILVNNAGILRDAMSFNLTETEWDDVIRVHLKGHAATCHFAAQHFRARAKAGDTEPTKRIINTTSESGLHGQPGQMNYSAAKAGIVSMTLVLARELRKNGVTANCIAPRALTRMTSSVPGAEQYMQGPEWEPANISPIVAWLAGDAAAEVSGQVFGVFGHSLLLVEGYTLANRIEARHGRFTAEEIAERADELFGERRRKVPHMGFGF